MPSHDPANSQPHVVVIRNARSDARAARRFAEALRARDMTVTLVSTMSAADGTARTEQALADGADVVVAAGGDGTVRSVVAALVDAPNNPHTLRPAALGVLPLGAANNFSAELGIRTLDDAVSCVAGATERAWDVGLCSYRGPDGAQQQSVFCTTAGVGLLARARRMGQTRPGEVLKRMFRSAAWAPLMTASAYATRPRMCRLQFDDVRVEHALSLLEISKLSAAGGVALTPDAQGDSGMLHAFIVGDAGMSELAGILYDALSGSLRHLQSEHVDYISSDPSLNRHRLSGVRRISVDADVPLPVHLNGDYVGTTPAFFELAPHALSVLAPAPPAMRLARVKALRAASVPPSLRLSEIPRVQC